MSMFNVQIYIFRFLPNLESSKVWKKPKYNFLIINVLFSRYIYIYIYKPVYVCVPVIKNKKQSLFGKFLYSFNT